MFITTAQELEEKTLAYWNVAQVWNGRKPEEVQTGEAIEVCSTILEMTNFVRPLFHHTDKLLQDIIVGDTTQQVNPCEVVALRM